ncbi:MAG: peptidoglycan D,D-transpeptidase FtsI family protein [Candidatus Poribacteria bacterium]
MVNIVRSVKHEQFSKKIYRRTSLALLLVELSFVLLVIRLFCIQCIDGEKLKAEAEKYHRKIVSVQPRRGAIYDRNHIPLAISTKSYSLFGDPQAIKEPESVALSLSSIIEIPKDDICRKLERNSRFVWIRRQLPDSTVDKIKSLNIPGINFREEGRRFYPQKELASHTIGFVGIDNFGLEGIEKKYDAYMRRLTSEFSTKKDRKGNDLEPNKYDKPAPGYDLILTLDAVIQDIAERELQSACRQWQAKGGSVIVMDPTNGEILAIANYPTYDLNKAFYVDSDYKRNRALIDLYEPGSTFKVITASAALNENLISPNDVINCEKGVYNAGKFVVHDTKNYDQLTFKEVIEESSNIGTVKIAKQLGSKKLYDYIKAFGLGDKTGVDTLESQGFIRNIDKWTERSMGSIPYGQEISVTALQMLCAVNAIANNGIIMKPFIVKKVVDGQETILENKPKISRMPISSRTAKIMRNILQGVVENGTGQLAKIDGYTVAGKTGTSQKASDDGKGYIPGKYTSSFVGFIPADKPVISIIVIIDEPQGQYYGSIVASPVFREIATQIMQYLTIGQGVCIAKANSST